MIPRGHAVENEQAMPRKAATKTRRAASPPAPVPRTVTFGVACSLDMFIARADHSVDWLRWSTDVTAITSAFWKSIDTVVMGRKSFDVAQGMGGASYGKVKCYVFSRTLAPQKTAGAEMVRGEAVEFVRGLRVQRGKGICVMGGGELARSLFEADVIDEVGLNIHPVLLGSGIPLFHAMPKQIDLELTECRQIQHGCVYVTYRVKR